MATFRISSTTNSRKYPGKYIEFDCIITHPPKSVFTHSRIQDTPLYGDVFSYSKRHFGMLTFDRTPNFFENMVHMMTLYGLGTLYWETNYDKLLLHTLFHTWWFYLDDCLDNGAFKNPEDWKAIVDIVRDYEGIRLAHGDTIKLPLTEILEISKIDSSLLLGIFIGAYEEVHNLLNKTISNYELKKHGLVKRFEAYMEIGGWDSSDKTEYYKLSFETFLQLKSWIVGVSGSYELLMLIEGISLDPKIQDSTLLQKLILISTEKAAIRNDIIGLRKDVAMEENANAILHRMNQGKRSEEEALSDVLQRHRELVSDYVYLKEKVLQEFQNHPCTFELKKFIEVVERYEYGAIFAQIYSPRYNRFEGSFKLVDLKLN